MANRCKDCKHDKGRCVGSTRRGSHQYCFEPKFMTNADRIRAMSDEELAKWLCSISTAECCDRSCPARDICDLNDNGMIKWLQQPLKEGEADG